MEAGPGSESGVIRGGLLCVRCGYDLNGRKVAEVCPECGGPVRESLVSAYLWPAEIRESVRRGAENLMTAALIGVGACVFAWTAALGGGGEVFFCGIGLMLCMGPVLAWLGTCNLRQSAEAAAKIGAISEGALSDARRAQWAGAAFALLYDTAIVGALMSLAEPTTFVFLIPLTLACACVAWAFRTWAAAGTLREMLRCCGRGERWAGGTRCIAAIAIVVWLGLIFPLTWLVFKLAPHPVMLLAVGLFIPTSVLMLMWIVLLWQVLAGLKRVNRSVRDRGVPVIERAAAPAEPAGFS